MRLEPRQQRIFLTFIALVMALSAIAAMLISPRGAFAGWLIAWLIYGNLPIGALFIAMMMEVIPGPWRRELGKPALRATFLLPVLMLGLIPLLFGIGELHQQSESLTNGGFRQAYMLTPFVILRSIFFLICAIAIGVCLLFRQYPYRSAIIGLLLLTPLQICLVTDWVISLDGKFHSSGFALYMLSLQVSGALAFLCLGRLRVNATHGNIGLLGTLLFVALLVRGYLTFMPYFISWSENLPAGSHWYLQRAQGLFGVAATGIFSSEFAAILLLILPQIRSSRRWLQGICLLTLLNIAAEFIWLVTPALSISTPVVLITAIIPLALFILLSIMMHQSSLRHRLSTVLDRPAKGIAA